MKILDSNTLQKDLIRADICIIGAGPAGVTLGAKLAHCNLDIIIVESGGRTFDETANKLNSLQIESNFTYRKDEILYNRQIGGTANLWVGRVVPFRFDPVLDAEWGDLKERVQGYYEEAFRFFGVEPELPRKHPGSDKTLVAYWAHQVERFNSKSELFKKNEDVKVYQHLTCIGEPKIESDRIKQLTFLSRNQNKICVQSKNYVFAMGAIENSRMLLLLRQQMGLKREDYLSNTGKYIMDHPRIWHGTINSYSDHSDAEKFQIKTTDWGLYKYGIRNNPHKTRVYCNFMRPVNYGNYLLNQLQIRALLVSAKWLITREKGLLRMISNEVSRLPGINKTDFLKDKLQKYFNLDTSNKYHVMTYCEQRPRIENQLVLTEKKDDYTLQTPKLINNFYREELEEVLGFFEKLKKQAESMDCNLEYDPEYLLDPGNYTDASHIMGGTRYSTEKKKAVVNENLNVIGISNLHITGSSVFPTSGIENPTHLIVSLSCYLSDVLKKLYDQ